MNPKKGVYLRAQAASLRSSGVSLRETAKIVAKSKSLVAKWSSSHARVLVVDHQSLTEPQRKLKKKQSIKGAILQERAATEEQRSA